MPPTDSALFYRRLGKDPMIRTVVRHGDISRTLSESKKYRGESYDIDFLGSYEDIYSFSSIIDCNSKEEVFNGLRHQTESDSSLRAYLSHELNYRKGKAELIHKKLLMQINIPEEHLAVSLHRQYVNFLFSEGYRYGDRRDDIAKLDPYLIPYEDHCNKYGK